MLSNLSREYLAAKKCARNIGLHADPRGKEGLTSGRGCGRGRGRRPTILDTSAKAKARSRSSSPSSGGKWREKWNARYGEEGGRRLAPSRRARARARDTSSSKGSATSGVREVLLLLLLRAEVAANFARRFPPFSARRTKRWGWKFSHFLPGEKVFKTCRPQRERERAEADAS